MPEISVRVVPYPLFDFVLERTLASIVKYLNYLNIIRLVCAVSVGVALASCGMLGPSSEGCRVALLGIDQMLGSQRALVWELARWRRFGYAVVLGADLSPRVVVGCVCVLSF